MRNNKRITPPGFNITSAVYIAGCLVWLMSQLSCKKDISVQVERRNIIESVYASAKIIAAQEHYIGAMANGTVVHKWVTEGDTIRKGQVLYEVQPITTKTGLHVAADRIDVLQQFETPPARSEIHYIRSSIHGQVYHTMKEVGEAVRMNESVALIGNTTNRIICMAVDQLDIGKVRTGQQVILKTDITGDTIYEAEVTKIYDLMNESNQTFRVDAVFKNEFLHSFIHTPAEANIIIRKKDNALVVPREAITDHHHVWMVKDGKTERIQVTTGMTTPDYIEILEGIDDAAMILKNPKN